MQTLATDRLVIAGVELRSRLFLGTGKYADDETMLEALNASGCELVTVALRRLDLDDPKKKTLLDVIDWKRYRILPNTAGCRTADEAIRIQRLAVGRGTRDGAGGGRCPGQHGHRAGPGSSADGRGHRGRCGSGTQGVHRWAHPQTRARQPQLAHRGHLAFALVIPVAMAIVTSASAGMKAGARATILQVRDPLSSARTIEQEAAALVATSPVPVVVSSRSDIALAVGAAGVNLPANDVPVAAARTLMGGRLVGRPVPSPENDLRAESEGADFALFGPVWASASHPASAPA